MNQIERMRVFLRVAELTSFTRAAETLALPKGTVSQAVSELEAELGTRLLHRTTRRVELTQDGSVFAERARDLVSDLDELTSHFQDGGAVLRGRVRADMSSNLARSVILPRLPEFLAAHPGIELELSSTDRFVDLAREGFDFTVRTTGRLDPNLIARPLGAFQVINCVSRLYASRFGLPRSLDELSRHTIVHYASVLGAPPDGFEYLDADGVLKTVPMHGPLTVSSAGAYLAAARAGLGLVQVPVVGVRPLLETGELIEVLSDFPAPSLPVSLVYLNRRHQPRRVRVFMDWVASLITPYLAS